MNCYALDACALIAFLYDELGANKVFEIFEQLEKRNAKIIMHKINLLEVYYESIKRRGESFAKKIVEKIYQRPIDIIPDISDALLFESGRFKTAYKISIADSIALATASVYNAKLVTSDHHEMDVIEQKENIGFYWIR